MQKYQNIFNCSKDRRIYYMKDFDVSVYVLIVYFKVRRRGVVLDDTSCCMCSHWTGSKE